MRNSCSCSGSEHQEAPQAAAGDRARGAYYKESYYFGYDEYGSMESQRAVDDCSIVGPGLINVVELAASIATYAGRVASAATPPQLPSE
jgi:hypothetical protein